MPSSRICELRRLRSWFFIAAAAVLLAGCGGKPAHAPVPRGATVLAFGDSVTFGTGAGPGEDYPSRLAALSGWTVINAGIPGDTARNAVGRINAALSDHTPALVIIEIGGNDFLRRHPETEIKNNIRTLLTSVRHSGVPVVLVATPRFSLVGAAFGSLSDAELFSELAKEENVPLVPGVFAAILSDATLKADPIHPNDAGYLKLAEGIAATLRKTGLLAP